MMLICHDANLPKMNLLFNLSKGVTEYEFQCNDSFIDVTPDKQIDRKPDYWYSMNCSVNGLWEGQFPLCIPRVQCPGLDHLEQDKDQSVIIESIENVYYENSVPTLLSHTKRGQFEGNMRSAIN